METDVHVLFQCCFAKEIWDSIGFSNLIRVIPNDAVLMVLQRAFQTGINDQVLMIVLLCWSIRQRKNSWMAAGKYVVVWGEV